MNDPFSCLCLLVIGGVVLLGIGICCYLKLKGSENTNRKEGGRQ